MPVVRLFRRRPSYLLFALALAWLAFTLAIVVQNWALVTIVWSTATLAEAISFTFGLYSAISTNFTILSAFLLGILSILFGVNIALMTYLLRHHVTVVKSASTNIIGVVFGVLGVGCAACGSVVLTSLLSMVGGTWLMALLPLGGEEFSFVGVGLMGYAAYILNKKLANPNVCSVQTNDTAARD